MGRARVFATLRLQRVSVAAPLDSIHFNSTPHSHTHSPRSFVASVRFHSIPLAAAAAASRRRSMRHSPARRASPREPCFARRKARARSYRRPRRARVATASTEASRARCPRRGFLNAARPSRTRKRRRRRSRMSYARRDARAVMSSRSGWITARAGSVWRCRTVARRRGRCER